MIVGLGRRERITPVLIELHWLPIKACIVYKICLLTHITIVTGKPGYLRDMLHVKQPVADVNTRSVIDGRKLVEPRCISNIGFRAFRSSAPRLYNKLSFELRRIENLSIFKKKLNTHLFIESYDLTDLTMKENFSS